MKKLLLLGAGSGSREVLLLVHRINEVEPTWEVVGFLDEDPEKIGKEVDDYPVVGPEHSSLGRDVFVSSGIMDPAVRQRMLEEHGEGNGYRLATLIAPDVVLPRDFAAGPGVVVMPSVIASFDVQLGKGVLAFWGSTLGHHLRVGEYATILSLAGITGGCKVGARATIGACACLNVGVTVGADALVGVGTTVLRDVPDGKSVVALPRTILSDRA